MAHFVLEYSANIDRETLSAQTLFEKLHNAAMETGIFPLKGLRSRAHRCNDFRIADGNPAHIFVHLSVLIGAGRSEEDKANAAKLIFDVFQQHFAPCFSSRGVALSFEMKELEPTLKYNKNNIENYLGE